MALQKKNFLRGFRERYSLRIHMCAILLATAASGALASKLLLLAHVDNVVIRYPLAVLLSYLVFFACIKLWLVYVTPGKPGGSGSYFVDGLDVPVVGSGGSSGDGVGAPFQGSGGTFAGGGASADFGVDAGVVTESLASVAVSDATSGVADGVGDVVGDAAGSAADGVGDVLGGAGDALGDEGGCLVVIVIALLAILLAGVLGASIYVIYQAPVILSEIALQGVLAAALTRRTKAMGQGDWVGSVFKATWKPFAFTLLAALMCGVMLQLYFPDATRLADIWR